MPASAHTLADGDSACKPARAHVQGSPGRSPLSRCCQGEGKGTSVLIVLSSLRHCVIAGREGEDEGASLSLSLSRGRGSGQERVVVRKRMTAQTRRRREGEGAAERESLSGRG